MAESVTLKAELRTGKGSRDADRLRKKGRIPGIIYGHKEETESVSMDHDELTKAIRHRVRNMELEINGKKESVRIQSIQHDFLGKDVIHVDFRRVSADERIEIIVPIELRGIAAGMNSGGVLEQPMHEIHIECLALSAPDSIRVKIDDLQIGQAIHVKELQLPPGIKALAKPDAVVVQIKLPGAEPVIGAIPAEGGVVEPEVITAKKPKDEAEE